MDGIAEVLSRYAACVTAGDVDGIVSLYAPTATIQIPADGPALRGIEAIRAFYRDNELAQQLEITGPVCVAGSEAAAPMRARLERDGHLLELDVIDVATRLTSVFFYRLSFWVPAVLAPITTATAS